MLIRKQFQLNFTRNPLKLYIMHKLHITNNFHTNIIKSRETVDSQFSSKTRT